MNMRRRWLPLALSGALVLAMVGAAQASGLNELLFPEALALLCGAWMLPRQAWNVDRPRMFALMVAGAVLGLCLNRLLDANVWIRAVLGYAFCAAAMALVGTDMTPMLSATILPILLGTTSWVYPVAVAALVALVAWGQMALERLGLREVVRFAPHRQPWRGALRSWGPRIAVFSLISAPFYLAGAKLFCVPPLVVAFTSLTNPDLPLRSHPACAWASLALAAVIGGFGRTVVEEANLPLLVIVAVCYVLQVLSWSLLGTWLPPAGAVLLLAFIVPYAGPFTYVLEVSVGAALWVGVAMLFPGIHPAMDLKK